MDEPNKRNSANSALTKKHFAKFHERIHNKYIEIQKRMHKSKSVDSISCLSEDFPIQNSKRLSSGDVIKYDEEQNVKRPVKYEIIVEDVNKNKVSFVDCYEVNNISTVEVTPSITVDNSDNNIFFADYVNIMNSSFESLYAEELKDNTPPPGSPNPSPSPRLSIKDKIGTKLSAAKERRREVKEKKELKKKEALDGVDKIILSNTSKLKTDSSKKKNKIASVTVALIEATGLENEATAEEKTHLFFCKIRLGTEKRKSKTIKTNSSENVVSWQELFNIGLFEDNFLEISMWDKDVLIGRTVLDLSEVEREKTHRMRLNLDEGVGNVEIFLLLTISGATLVNTFADLEDYQESQKRFETLKKKYAWSHLNNNSSDIVGWVSIILYGAKGLASHDTYCVVELENDRLHSHTEYKTCDPNWMKMMDFAVRDITSILAITVFDEKKSEPVGKLCIPLLKVENGHTKWYALKDNNLRERAKGHNPRILLEIKVYFNLIKASLKVVNPKEPNYLETEQEFNRHVFGNNVTRAKAVVSWTLDAIKFLKTCFEWESRKSNTIALSIWVLFWWLYKAWMFPLLLLIPFALYRPRKYYLIKRFKKETVKKEEVEDKEEKNKSLRQKINSLQDTVQSVQNGIGNLAVFGESVKNLCNFTIPFLSVLAIFLILVASFVIYLIPFTYLLIGWGVHKFLRKILWPNRIPNNEILDLLSRVPDDETLNQCEELPLLEMTEEDEIN